VGSLLSLFANFWLGALGGVVGMTATGLAISTQVCDMIITAVVGLYFWRDVLDRDFGKFRVCILPKGQDSTTNVRDSK